MRSSFLSRVFHAPIFLILCAIACGHAHAADFTVTGYTVVSSTRITRTVFDYVLRPTVKNNLGYAVNDLKGTVVSTIPTITISDNQADFGSLGAGASRASSDTIKIRQDRTAGFDPAGLVWTFTKTIPPPTIVIGSPADGAHFTSETVAVSGQVGGTFLTVTVNGVPASLSGNTFSATVPLAIGPNIITAQVNGPESLTAQQSITVHRDAPPTIQISSPAHNTQTVAAMIEVSGSYGGEVSGITVNGVAAALSSGSFSATVALQFGPNTLTAIANGPGGSSQDSVTVVRKEPFAIKITSPTALTLFSTPTITVTGTAGPDAAEVGVNGIQAAMNGNGTWSVSITLQEGNNVLTAVGYSATDETATDSIQVTLDSTPPAVTILTPKDGTVFAQKKITVTGNINDVVVGTVNGEQATVAVNGVDALVVNRTFAVQDFSLDLGPNVITALGKDKAGNQKTTSISVFYNPVTGDRVEVVSGNNQTAQISQMLGQPLVVRAIDAAGTPIPGKNIIFKVTENDGEITHDGKTASSLIVPSGDDGTAQVLFRLGTRAGAGNNQVSAAIVGFEGEVVFTASATPGSPGLLVPDFGNNQIGVVGQPLPRPFITIVVDSGNNRLYNVPVTFTVVEGGGSFNGLSSVTVNSDSDGRSLAIFTLGPEEGNDNNIVTANFPDNLGAPVTFVASSRVAGDELETSISGVVLDNSDIPVPGVTMRILGYPDAVLSDENGFFRIKPAPVGTVRLIADGSTATRPGSWVWLQFDMVTIAGRDNDIGRPVRLIHMDMENALFVDETHGGVLTLPHAPGYSLTVAPGSVTFPNGSKSGHVSVTIVHPDKMPDPPSFGQQPLFLVSIQPANAVFSPPAAMCIPNLEALPPGQKTDMYSYDHDMERFISIGTGTVSEDGMQICSDPGNGVIKGGWHCGGNPQQVAAGMTSKVTVDKNKIEGFKGEVTATGTPTPPHNNPFDWKKDFTGIPAADQGDITFTLSGGGSQSTATIKGTKAGKVRLMVRYRCKSAQWSSYKVVEITVPKVQFVEDGTNYGFDNFTDAKKPAKSVEEGKTDTVKGVVTPAAGFAGLEYISANEAFIKVAPKAAASGNQTLTVSGIALGETVVEAKAEGSVHATMVAKTYKKLSKTVAVTLIHEKASATNDLGYSSTDVSDADLIAAMKLAYKQAVIEWTVVRKAAKTVEFDLNNDGKVDVDTWMSAEMAAIRDAAQTAEDFNIYLVDKPSDGSLGFMDFNQKHGFMHADNIKGDALVIAHEIGHGHGLQHTPLDADNLMHPTNLNVHRLRKAQWDHLNP